jgi:hypothetical protein
MKSKAITKWERLIQIAPVEWELQADKMTSFERDEMCARLEGIAERCGMLSAYLYERCGYGCGDRGHTNAVKKANKVGRIIHCKAFGYNAFHDLSI